MSQTRMFLLGVALAALTALPACGPATPAPSSITVLAKDIEYGTKEIRVKVGQQLTVELDNIGALEHNLLIDELSVDIANVAAGSKKSATFTPQAAGQYEFYCNVPGHREAGMVGKLIVEP